MSFPCSARPPVQSHTKKHVDVEQASITSGARRNKPRPAPYCMVLPSGEFTGMNTEPLSVYFKNFATTA